ncbi:hypothetical protein BN2475_20021 [Paraburkholderia ribeironis]|uniref:Uncharacterized protein n=1 Tax=Paraburkholderia ribeironis TaxID=1247936 RepID=A0A1N7RIP0_9BURK|nr:hypothetical protein BN2475_20021 [Paraburkholderia ribeironis]
MCFGVHASAGHTQKACAAKLMLRIVNMQKRLRPVYPGIGAIDFAIGIRDLVTLNPPTGRWFKQVAENFGI